eukprot:comp12559_c0_seq1/m.7560 comp12559_c0_seq1/g.7560  ORF comp12559_c0_seq1/g.7560 comp12559_c0_seq1/m.7560 type:complete len:396 (-) comp12559_c0_seq1:122-1309(-)
MKMMVSSVARAMGGLKTQSVIRPLAVRMFSSSATRRAEATFDLPEVHLHKLDQGPATKATMTDEEGLKWYRQMQVIRRMETAASDLYKAKFIRGFCHLYSGQEAVAGGIMSVLQPGKDHVITSYRCHGFTYLHGASVLGVLAELLGRSDGVSKGKGGSMHMYWDNFFGGNGIVGAQAPLGAGLAFAQKYQGTGGVTIAGYGDGAANQGQLFEAYNMSKLWDLPVIYLVENNRYGMGTSQERSSASFQYYTRGDYVPGIQVNGMDILAVREATKFAADYCRSGKGPIIVEAVTYRYGGHSMSDPGTSYRTREEIKLMRAKSDPIQGLKLRLLESGLATEDKIKEVDASVKKEVEDAVEKAKASPEIGLEELYNDVTVIPPPKIRGADNFSYHYPKH